MNLHQNIVWAEKGETVHCVCVCVCVCGGGGGLQTALHWAAKQGCQDAVDMMLRSGADVNVKSVSSECVCVRACVRSSLAYINTPST